MTDITEHDTEKEGENGNGEESRVYFLVSWHTVSVNDLLEWSSEGVHLEVSWWLLIRLRLTDSHN